MKNLFDYLIERRLIIPDQLKDAKDKQVGIQRPLQDLLVEMGFIADEILTPAVSAFSNLEIRDFQIKDIDPLAVQCVPYSQMLKFCVVPYKIDGIFLELAMTNPTDTEAIKNIQLLTSKPIKPILILRKTLLMCLDAFGINDETVNRLVNYGPSNIKVDINEENRLSYFSSLPVELKTLIQKDSPTVKLINLIIADAFKTKAKQIFFEPKMNSLVVSYFTANDYKDLLVLDLKLYSKIIACIKIMAAMDITVSTKHQYGEIKCILNNHKVALSTEAVVNSMGEKIIIGLEGLKLDHYVDKTKVRVTSPVAQKKNHKPKILIVDDSETMLLVLLNYFKGSSYDLTYAVNGKEAIDKVLREKVDLIITDIDMPVMDGIEEIKILRSNMETSKLPIIILTEKEGPEAELALIDAGADDYILKPSTQEKILSRVGMLLKRRQLDY